MIQPLLIPTAAEKRIDTDFYVEGYATTFDKPYLLYEWDGNKYYERIDRNALAGADMSDVIMQYNHEGKVLARLSNGTLGVEANDNGLFTFADLSKSRAAQDMFEEIKNGLVTKMSWAFRVSEDSYDRDTRTRTILKIAKVYDVSAVSIPANADTDISARSYFDGVIEREQQERLERRKKLLKIKLMDINSPSKVFARIGSYMAQGLGEGFAREMRDVESSIRRETSNAVPEFRSGEGRDTRGGGTPSVEVVQNIYANETSYAEQQRQAARQFRQIAREVMA